MRQVQSCGTEISFLSCSIDPRLEFSPVCSGPRTYVEHMWQIPHADIILVDKMSILSSRKEDSYERDIQDLIYVSA